MPNFSWHQQLRARRKNLGLTRQQLSDAVRVPVNTLRRWEDGTRRPEEASLRNVLDALGAVGDDANSILEDAGYLPNRTLWAEDRFPEYYFKSDELDDAVEQVPWPCFVVNQNTEIVAANSLIQRLWGIDLKVERERRTTAQLHLLAVASDRRFVDRIANWRECLATMVAVAKSQPRGSESLDHPAPYFSQVVAEYLSGDPALLRLLFEVWSMTDPQPIKVRWSYRVDWKASDGDELHFKCMVTVGSETDNFGFNDWIPLDGATWDAVTAMDSNDRRRRT